MEYQSIVSAIDDDLRKLQQVRALLAKGGNLDGLIAGQSTGNKAPAKRAARRTLSPEARARVAAAQKKRWAAAKKTAK